MKSKIPCCISAIFCLLVGGALSAFAQGTTFTYQGRVTDNGTDFTGAGQFQFALVTSTNFNHTATATANPPSGGFITGYAVTSGGSGYVTPPVVTIFGGGGSGAAATANLSGGVVASLTVNNTGNGAYTTAPTVTIAPPPANLSFTTYWSNDGTSVNGSEPAAAITISVTNGLFTVVLGNTTIPNMLSIGAALFNQPNLQLRIWFNDGVNGFAALSPVQNLTPTPYATYAASAGGLSSGLTVQLNTNGAPNVIGGSSNNYISNGVVGATIGGGGAVNYQNVAYSNSVTVIFGTVGGGRGNTASGDSATVGGGFDNTASSDSTTVSGGFGNLASNGSTTVGGGFDNIASGNVATVGGGGRNTAGGDYSTVAGGRSNLASTNYAAVGGGSHDTASGQFAMVGGGGTNSATGDYATVSGGYRNTASGYGATVAGGGNDNGNAWGNTASGDGSFIGGGVKNTTTINGQEATVGGGFGNTASALVATVSGGINNIATNGGATVPGGDSNVAGGSDSFAAGARAQAIHDGTFVWSDNTTATASLVANSVTFRASGGYRLITGTGTAGAQLLAGATSWTTLSDRNAKKNFQAVDTKAVLDKLAAISVQEWNYNWEKDSDVPNIGPMAQDFKHAFYPGRDDTGISTLEFDGVELAAIQGLNQKVEAKDAEIQDLKTRLERLEQIILKQKSN
jgi:hypothetical protein